MSFATMGVNAILWVLQVIILIVGVVLTAMARRNHGRAALVGMFGCLVFLLDVIVSVVQAIILPELARDIGSVMTAVMIISVVHMLLWMTGIGLLVAAVVMRRPAAPQQPHPGQPQPNQPYPNQPSYPPQQPYYQQQPPPPGYPGH
ncbi:hypothetical protein [Nonomuraea soli]|uniref:Uncharacterized protein n=1 Tax=Nonomuraea soli TaxID=1032476 RepID=A0A7W0HVD2_9ACTN|nr:hypothetical protein [Nonomuraea soli]MBA2896902.1 hypothetical protein [Nonomuraea soli]